MGWGMEIIYSEIPGLDKKFFECDLLRCRLSTESCAINHRKSKTLPRGSGASIDKCADCSVGAQHAGIPFAPKVRVIGSMICARCHSPSSRIVCDGICPSCHARQKEVEKGVNAKGTKPRPSERFWSAEGINSKTLFMHSVSATMITPVDGVSPVSMPAVADTLELMLRASRGAAGRVSFSRPIPMMALSRGLLGGGGVICHRSHPGRNGAISINPVQQNLFG